MRTLVMLLALPAALANGQSTSAPAPQTPPAQPPAAATAPAELTVEQTASPELVGQLVKDLSVTPAQAQGAAGSLFGVAKTKLSATDSARIARAAPNMEGLLKAAKLAPTLVKAVQSKGGAEVAALLQGTLK